MGKKPCTSLQACMSQMRPFPQPLAAHPSDGHSGELGTIQPFNVSLAVDRATIAVVFVGINDMDTSNPHSSGPEEFQVPLTAQALPSATPSFPAPLPCPAFLQ
jgi:hypothetical protein